MRIQNGELYTGGNAAQVTLWAQRMLNEHVSGKLDHNYRLWMLFNLEVFYRHFFEGESVEELEGWISADRS